MIASLSSGKRRIRHAVRPDYPRPRSTADAVHWARALCGHQVKVPTSGVDAFGDTPVECRCLSCDEKAAR